MSLHKARAPTSVSNGKIAESLRRYGAILALEEDDRFRAKAYRLAANTVESLDVEIASLVEDGFDLTALPGIGKGIGGVIEELVATGVFRRLIEKENLLAPGFAELIG